MMAPYMTPPRVKVLAKAARVLEALADSPDLTAPMLAQRLGEPRPTVYRLVQDLEALDYVEAGPRPGTYRLGLELFRLGSLVRERFDVRELAGPALEEIGSRYGVRPARLLADGGYDSKADIEKLHESGVVLFCPLPKKKDGRRDPALPQQDDGPGTLAWRQRMATAEARAVYQRRFATERPHAHMRNHGLRQLCVRGIEKVKAVALWHVHAFNFLQFKRLGIA